MRSNTSDPSNTPSTAPVAAAFAAGPLQGVRIIDLTTVVLGPYATRILADMGADVIKVETFGGDQIRHYLPTRNPGMSGFFINLNRNKRSIALDLKKPDGLAALKKLLATADAFMHNLRPQAAARLGPDYPGVRALNANIVYCAATGFGSTGPYAGKAAYDDAIQAGSGMAALNARVTGTPAYAPTLVCDKVTGQAVAYAVLGALYQQARGGGGQAVEVPMLETAAEFALVEHLHAATFEPPLSDLGFNRVLSRFRKPYRTADGCICLLPYSDENWREFYRYTGRTEFEGDPRFARPPDRVQNIDVLYGVRCRRNTARSLRLDARLAHRGAPLGDFLTKEGAELGQRVGGDGVALALEALQHRRVGGRLADRGIEPVDRRRRRARGGENAVPGIGLEPGQAGFGHGGNIRRRLRALTVA